jgi:hypothetical protein
MVRGEAGFPIRSVHLLRALRSPTRRLRKQLRPRPHPIRQHSLEAASASTRSGSGRRRRRDGRKKPGFRIKRKCSLLRALAWAVNAGGHEERQALGSDRLACFLAKNAHEPPQEPLHQPERALHLVLTGQNRSLLWPCALSRSLGQAGTCCGQLFPFKAAFSFASRSISPCSAACSSGTRRHW